MQTRTCCLCFKAIPNNNLYHLFRSPLICFSCSKTLSSHFQKFKVLGCDGYSIYDYDENIQSMLFQFKGCYDIALGDVFLERYINELSFLFYGYTGVYIPSYKGDDQNREFNHVEVMFQQLKINKVKALSKTSHFKQANNSKNKRKEIAKFLIFSGNKKDITGKKILLLDDVYTTGSTMKAAIRIIQKFHPAKIKVLVMAKTINKKANNIK